MIMNFILGSFWWEIFSYKFWIFSSISIQGVCINRLEPLKPTGIDATALLDASIDEA